MHTDPNRSHPAPRRRRTHSVAALPLRLLLGITCALLAGLTANGAPPQQTRQIPGQPVSVTGTGVESAAPGSETQLVLRATIDPGYHIYSLNYLGQNQRVEVTVGEVPGLEVGTITESAPRAKPKPEGVSLEHYGTAVFTIPVKVAVDAESGERRVPVEFLYQVCDEFMCLPVQTLRFQLPLVVGASDGAPKGGATVPASAEPAEAAAAGPADVAGSASAAPVGEVTKSDLDGHVTVVARGARGARGARVELVLTARIAAGWHIYGLAQNPELGVPTAIELTRADGFEAAGAATEPTPHARKDPILGGTLLEHEGEVPFVLGLSIPRDRAPGQYSVGVKFSAQACDAEMCLPPFSLDFDLPVIVTDAAPVSAAATRATSESEGDPEAGAEEDLMRTGLLSFLLLAVGWGLFALVMPCTYPMIPITISFFTKQAEARSGKVLPLSLCYGGGIVAIFILIGIVIGPVIIPFATHWATNLVIAVAFGFFALALFGAIDLQPPQFLLGLAGKASQEGGYAGVFLMGATLVITSFTCTAPFVGNLLAVGANSGDLSRVALGMGTFGLTMAVPFVILSLVPGRMAALPRAGEWMNTLKVTLGFVEVAAAMKFLSNADLVLQWHILPRELFLLLWAVIFAIAGLFLLGVVRLEGKGEGGIAAGRLVGATAVLLFAAYCGFGALGNRLDWIMASIAPNYSAPQTIARGEASAMGHSIVVDDYDSARSLALRENKRLLVNFTGYT